MHGVGRAVRGLVVLGLALLVLALVGGLALAWRLGQGPVDVSWALPRIEAALNREGAATRVHVAGAGLEWGGFADGFGRGLDLTLRELRVLEGERVLARAAALSVNVSVRGLLLRGAALPRFIEASGVELHLVRAADGAVGLDVGTPDVAETGETAVPDLTEVLAELARPPRAEGAGPVRTELEQLRQFRHIRVSDAVVMLHDRELGGRWRLDLGGLELDRQAEGGLLGRADARLAVGGAAASVTMQAALAPEGGTSVQLVLAPFATGPAQRAAETQGVGAGGALGPVGQLETALQGSVSLTLDARLLPVAGSVQVRASGGRVRLAGSLIGFDSLNVEADASWAVPGWGRPSTVALSRLKAVLQAPGGAWPTTVTASGTVRREGERFSGTVAASLDHLAFTDIPRLWPERWGGHVRPWLVKSITAGTARDGVIAAAFSVSSAMDDLVLTRIDASVAGDDTTIHWLRPIAPVEHAQAVLRIRSPEVMDIAIASARQGVVPLTNGTIHITGLNVKDQFMTLGADAAGPVAEVITLLKHPALHLLDRKPIPMRNPGGSFTGHIGVFLPLNEDLDLDDVKITVQAKSGDLRLGGLVAGRDLERGEIQVEASSESLKAQGRAAISGLASEIAVEMDFRNGGPAQVVQRDSLVTRATPQQLAAAGIDTGGLIEGGVGVFTARYVQRRDGAAELGLSANLRDAVLGIAGWSKAAGVPGEAGARLLLRGEQVLGVDQVRAQAPGLAVEGRMELVGDRPLLLRLDRLVLGGTRGSGEVRLPGRAGEAVRARLEGAVLDLSALLAQRGPPPSGNEAPWVADVRFDRVVLAKDRGLDGLTAHAESARGRVVALQAVSAGAEKLAVTIARAGTGRTLSVTAADGGAVLRAMDLVDSVQGGALSLRATYDDTRADSPLSGTVELRSFRMRNAPGLGKLLQAVTVYGVVEALSGPGLSFNALSMPFTWNGSVLDVVDVQAFSASLGLTAQGRVDTVRKTVDLRGTVVPVYVINSMLGRIPLLGRLFSAEKGGGLLAVNYSLRGPLGDPGVSVNPLSALTPGFLRGLFKVLD